MKRKRLRPLSGLDLVNTLRGLEQAVPSIDLGNPLEAGIDRIGREAIANESILCVSAPKSGPHPSRLQLIDSTLNPALRVGSRSAPIGTPLKEPILKCYQHIGSIPAKVRNAT